MSVRRGWSFTWIATACTLRLTLALLLVAVLGCSGAPSRKKVREVVNAYYQANPEAKGCIDIRTIIPPGRDLDRPFPVTWRGSKWRTHLRDEGLFRFHRRKERRRGTRILDPIDYWVMTEKGRRFLLNERCLKFADVSVDEVHDRRDPSGDRFWTTWVKLRYANMADWVLDPKAEFAPGVMEAKDPRFLSEYLVFTHGRWWHRNDEWPRGPE